MRNIVRNGSLWSDVVFEKEEIFHYFDFETSSLEFEVSKSSIWKHKTLCDKGVFSCVFISQLAPTINRAQIFTGLLFYACWDTPSEKTGLWQLPIVSIVFKTLIRKWIFYYYEHLNDVRKTKVIKQGAHFKCTQNVPISNSSQFNQNYYYSSPNTFNLWPFLVHCVCV